MPLYEKWQGAWKWQLRSYLQKSQVHLGDGSNFEPYCIYISHKLRLELSRQFNPSLKITVRSQWLPLWLIGSHLHLFSSMLPWSEYIPSVTTFLQILIFVPLHSRGTCIVSTAHFCRSTRGAQLLKKAISRGSISGSCCSGQKSGRAGTDPI